MVRTMNEIQADPARVRVTVDVELSGVVGLAAAQNRIQVLEAELDLLRSSTKTDHDEIMRSRELIERVRQAVWTKSLDHVMENRNEDPADWSTFLVEAVAFVRASVGQP